MIGKSLQDFFSTDMATDGWTQLRAMVSNRSAFRDLRCSYADKTGATADLPRGRPADSGQDR